MKQLLLFYLLFFSTFAFGQETKTKIERVNPDVKVEKNIGEKSTKTQSSQSVEPDKVIKTGKSVGGEKNEHEAKIRRGKEWNEKLKKKENLQKREQGKGENTSVGLRSESTSLGKHFDANVMKDGTPPDNSIAISNGGKIISMDNYSIAFYNANGTLINSFTHADFFSKLDLSAGTADPKVIYDSDKDRFIMFLQSGSKSWNSKIIVAFSSTNNPSDKWWTYTFNDFTSKSYWYDYPNIGLSSSSFYLTGNLFSNNSGSVKDNIVYQINKEQGYLGQTVSYNTWYSLKEGVNIAYSIVPASFGQQGNYGPGIYMVATEGNPTLFGKIDEIYLYDITDEITGTPQVDKYSIKIPAFDYTSGSGVPALQPNTSIKLDVGDPRMKSAFFLNDIIHFTFNREINSAGYTGITYGRLDTKNLTIKTQETYNDLSDYAYPSVASIGKNKFDKSVILTFHKSDNSTFPEVRYKYYDDNMNQETSSLIRQGEGPVNITGDKIDRWGDYTGIQRRHNDNTVWLVGAFGTKQNGWRAHIAEVKLGTSTSTEQVSNFQEDNINISPNPSNKYFNVKFNNFQSSINEIELYDMDGRIIKKLYNGFLEVGEQNLDFSVPEISVGTYNLIIKSNGKKISKKIIFI